MPFLRIALAAVVVTCAAFFDAAFAQSVDSTGTAVAQATTDADGEPVSLEGLQPSSDPPWNPPAALPRRRAWEMVMLLPGRLVTLPLTGIGWLADREFLTLEQSAALPKVQGLVKRGRGFLVRPMIAKLGDRTGFGLGVKATAPGPLNFLSATTSGSTLKYSSTHVDARMRHLNLQWGYDWRPEDRFYGVGLATDPDDTTSYASRSTYVKAEMFGGWNASKEWPIPRTEFRAWIGPRNFVTRRGREDDVPSIEERFPDVVATTLDRHIEHLVYGARFYNDWRRGAPHWAAGWRIELQGQRFDRPLKALALKSARPEGAQFTRYEYELESGRSMYRDPRTLRVLLRVVDTDVTSGGERFLVDDMARLGGREGLGGFEPGRFHDLDLGLGKVTYVFPLVQRLEAEMHAEAGGVYHDVWNDLTLRGLRTSYGVSVRPRFDHPILSFGVDWSKETTRFRFAVLGTLE